MVIRNQCLAYARPTGSFQANRAPLSPPHTTPQHTTPHRKTRVVHSPFSHVVQSLKPGPCSPSALHSSPTRAAHCPTTDPRVHAPTEREDPRLCVPAAKSAFRSQPAPRLAHHALLHANMNVTAAPPLPNGSPSNTPTLQPLLQTPRASSPSAGRQAVPCPTWLPHPCVQAKLRQASAQCAPQSGRFFPHCA